MFIQGISVSSYFKFHVKVILNWRQLDGVVEKVVNTGDTIKIKIITWELIFFPLGIRSKQGEFICIMFSLCYCITVR